MESSQISNKSKMIKKVKSTAELEQDRAFDALKRKYANAVVYLLVKNVPRKELHSYFQDGEENQRRFETIKKIRADIIAARPKAKIWIDKAFYSKLDLGKQVDAETREVQIVLGECVFKQKTKVVSNRVELDMYMETIAKIIDAEKVWADPEMVDFDIGERDFLTETTKSDLQKVSSEAPM